LESSEVTSLLKRAAGGEESAAQRLLPLVYDELRALANSYFASERNDHTLQATAIVHEAYVRLVSGGETDWNDRAHFFRTAALAMRRVLVNHARDRARLKRGGGQDRIPTLSEVANDDSEHDLALDVLALNEAIEELSGVDPRKASILELKFFAGMTIEQIARVVDISEAQVKREWRAARAYLMSRMDDESSDER
jgi:RNA polymerase sigma-70 factor (ECF subfamily)